MRVLHRSRSFWIALSVLFLCVTTVQISKVAGDKPEDSQSEDDLEDDDIKSKHPVFDQDLVDSRVHRGWSVNSSDAVIKLDTPPVRADLTPELTRLYSSYEAAYKAGPEDKQQLVSVNMLDAKGKQFDDGLYAALDQAYYKGLQDRLPSPRHFNSQNL